ncbi:MAG: hypothetical protein HYS41_06405 [Candidatus Omnitrophica bacterium]|nr:hypothetical protein [Candidatus Omnitrophota bacterium]
MATAKILLAAAVRPELASFPRKLHAKVDLLFTGMGKQAHRAAARALAAESYRLVVSSGFAAGARTGLKTGDLVAAEEVVDAVSGEVLVSRRPAVNGSVALGRFVTVPRVIAGPRGKEQAGRRWQAAAIEMETFHVARAASQAGVPWVGLRVILDPMEVSLLRGVLGFLPAVRLASRSLADGLGKFIEGGIDGSG